MQDIKNVSINNKDYPQALKEIHNAPSKIYFKGKLIPRPARNAAPARKASLSDAGGHSAAGGPARNASQASKVACSRSDAGGEDCVAVVGARMCSSYGKQAALEIASDLARAGVTVISGLAPGIDTIAHQAVVEQGARTVAVLGTGIDEASVYPRDNIGLARKIIDTGGCLISEYPPGTRGTHFTFPQRNRIVSGLSRAVVVIEAKQKSGALITANWAKKQGRKIFAVPGSIYSGNSMGCHYLIKNGAKLVDNSRDILQELNLMAQFRPGVSPQAETTHESLILQALVPGPLYIDRIIEKTQLSPAAAASTLAVMEIQGKVRNLGRSVYALSR